MQAARRAKIPQANVCGGVGRCSACRVHVLAGQEHCSPRTAEEQAIAARLHFLPSVRLACQTVPIGSVKVRRLVEDLEDVDIDSLYIQEGEVCAIGEDKNVLIFLAISRDSLHLLKASRHST